MGVIKKLASGITIGDLLAKSEASQLAINITNINNFQRDTSNFIYLLIYLYENRIFCADP